ncbi:uncharacterized protein LOC113214008 [Frankliniella occidentalis]|uniref:Uncharacterized protein LOC113214008 n=1 Tax=Frankliniella occidentalis TaxID=133901 RepID=A0A6J1TDU7_FRAOC|nr:uncharacterized protein LOC113214008 [Frankliniella occidentalis]XP_052132246.1 uncharacterized protein LOC113214008 [Frankliniella occidentalis]
MSPLIGLLLVAPSLAMAALPPRPHDGLQFKPLPRVLASSAQLVIIRFNITIPDLKATMHHLTATLEAKLNMMTPNQTGVVRDVIGDLENMYERLDLHFNDVQKTARRNAHRNKRSINPLNSLSELLGFCCGFMTAEDRRALEARDDAVWDRLTEEVDRTQNAFYESQGKLVKELNVWKEYAERMQHELTQDINIRLGYASHVDMTAALVNSLAFDTLLVAERIRSIEAACVAGRIPSTVVDQTDLAYIVARVHKENPRQRVAVDDIDALFKLEMASCQFSKHELKVMAWFPLEPKQESSARLKTYDVMPIAFLYEEQVCQLLKHPVVAVVAERSDTSKTVVRLLEGEQRTRCLSRPVCNVPRITEAEDMACINGVLTGAEIRELKSVCSFTCQPYRRLQIVHIGHNNYSVVNKDRDLVVRCSEVQNRDVPRRTEGALLLEVPCSCTLEDRDKGVVLIERQQPCDKNYSSAINVIPIVPKLWMVDDYARLTVNMTEVPTEEFKSSFMNFTPPSSEFFRYTPPPPPPSEGFWEALQKWLPTALLQLPSLVLLVIMFRQLQRQHQRLRKLGV